MKNLIASLLKGILSHFSAEEVEIEVVTFVVQQAAAKDLEEARKIILAIKTGVDAAYAALPPETVVEA